MSKKRAPNGSPNKVTLNCDNCSAEFLVWPSRLKVVTRGKFCSHSCRAIESHKHRVYKSLTEEHKKNISIGGARAIREGRHKVFNVAGWNKGVPHKPETREKIRQIAIDRGFGSQNKGRKRPDLSKRNWRGGVTPENVLARHSPEYKAWRTAVFQRDQYKCQHCGKRGGELHADHIKPFCLYIELRTTLDNGRTLCAPCHRKTDTYKLNGHTLKKLAIKEEEHEQDLGNRGQRVHSL